MASVEVNMWGGVWNVASEKSTEMVEENGSNLPE